MRALNKRYHHMHVHVAVRWNITPSAGEMAVRGQKVRSSCAVAGRAFASFAFAAHGALSHTSSIPHRARLQARQPGLRASMLAFEHAAATCGADV